MFDYKYEMHTHSKACSACASSSSEDIVRKAKECGYAGVFFTNHFYFGNSAIDRSLPKIDMGDLLVIHDTGAHGYAMGYNYNGKLKSAELLLKEDGSVQMIRRAETAKDYFATFDCFDIFNKIN